MADTDLVMPRNSQLKNVKTNGQSMQSLLPKDVFCKGKVNLVVIRVTPHVTSKAWDMEQWIVSECRVGHVCYLQMQSQVDSTARACESPLEFVIAALLSNLTAHVTVWAVYGTRTTLGFALVCSPLSSVVHQPNSSHAMARFAGPQLSYSCGFPKGARGVGVNAWGDRVWVDASCGHIHLIRWPATSPTELAKKGISQRPMPGRFSSCLATRVASVQDTRIILNHRLRSLGQIRLQALVWLFRASSLHCPLAPARPRKVLEPIPPCDKRAAWWSSAQGRCREHLASSSAQNLPCSARLSQGGELSH